MNLKMNDEGDDEQMAEYCWNYHWYVVMTSFTHFFLGAVQIPLQRNCFTANTGR